MKERAVFLFFFLFTLRFLFFYLIEYTVKILNNVYRTNLFSAVFQSDITETVPVTTLHSGCPQKFAGILSFLNFYLFKTFSI